MGKRLHSADLVDLILEGLKQNEAKKLTWSCSYCDNSIPHFHASSVGYCQRKLQYGILFGLKHRQFASTELAFLRDGHINENIVKEGLKGAGVKLLYHDSVVDKSYKDVIIVMHTDVLFEYENNIYVIEQKSLKDDSYKKLVSRKEPMREWYIDQLTVYMNYFTKALSRKVYGFIFLKRRSTSEFYPFPYNLDLKRMNKIYSKLQNIMEHIKKGKLIKRPYKEVEFSKKPFECKVCQFYEQCYGSIYQ